MQFFTFYQLNEIILGTLYFAILYIGITYLYQGIEFMNVITTIIIFGVWILTTKFVSNYIKFISTINVYG